MPARRARLPRYRERTTEREVGAPSMMRRAANRLLHFQRRRAGRDDDEESARVTSRRRRAVLRSSATAAPAALPPPSPSPPVFQDRPFGPKPAPTPPRPSVVRARTRRADPAQLDSSAGLPSPRWRVAAAPRLRGPRVANVAAIRQAASASPFAASVALRLGGERCGGLLATASFGESSRPAPVASEAKDA